VTGHLVQLKGQRQFAITNSSSSIPIQFLVYDGPSILGLDGLRSLGNELSLSCLVAVSASPYECPGDISTLIDICGRAEGGLSIPPVQIPVKGDPVFRKSRPLPFGLRTPVKAVIDKLVDQNVLVPVESSRWATPIVTPLKSDGSPRVCGDFKVSVNPLLYQKATTTLEAEDMFAALKHASFFSKVDFQNAFLQIPLDKKSQELTTLNTMWGLYAHRFLPFGLTSSPSIFQEFMDTLCKDLIGVRAYQDDILVFGSDRPSHDKALLNLLKRLVQYNVKINVKKSVFGVTQLDYLGYRISIRGIEPNADRLRPIVEAPLPTDCSQLRSWLGCMQYYSRFIPNFAELAGPLFSLATGSSSDFCWTDKYNSAFKEISSAILSCKPLIPFSTDEPISLIVDASEYAIGGVLEQDGRPVICVSRKMSSAETGYSQTQREALSIIWCVKRLHKYLFGTHFTLVTDHQSLQYIFSEKSSASKATSNMLQRWAIALSGYNYTVIHRPGRHIPQADFLSRYACFEEPDEKLSLFVQPLPVDRNSVISETRRVYGPVLAALRRGWSNSAKKNFQRLYAKREELSVSPDGVLCLNELTVVPPILRRPFLEHLHSGHIGVDKMKSLSRLICWWPELNEDIISFCRNCVKCKECKPRTHPSWSPWPLTYRPFQRVHVDYLGPLLDDNTPERPMQSEVKPLSNADNTAEQPTPSEGTPPSARDVAMPRDVELPTKRVCRAPARLNDYVRFSEKERSCNS
jgi:hypothetical protein